MLRLSCLWRVVRILHGFIEHCFALVIYYPCLSLTPSLSLVCLLLFRFPISGCCIKPLSLSPLLLFLLLFLWDLHVMSSDILLVSGACTASGEMYSFKLLLTAKLFTELLLRYYNCSWADVQMTLVVLHLLRHKTFASKSWGLNMTFCTVAGDVS